MKNRSIYNKIFFSVVLSIFLLAGCGNNKSISARKDEILDKETITTEDIATVTPEPTEAVVPTATSTPTPTPTPTATNTPMPTPTPIGGYIGDIRWIYENKTLQLEGQGEIAKDTIEAIEEELGWSHINKIIISGNIDEIGNSAFSSSYGLEIIEITANVQRIGRSAFSYCTHLTAIDIPISVEIIHDSAFYECSRLQQLIIRNPVAIIEDDILEYVPDVTIYGFEGSSAEMYAERNSIDFETLADEIVWPTSSLEFNFVYDAGSFDIIAYVMGVDGRCAEDFFSDIGESYVDIEKQNGIIKCSKGSKCYLEVLEDKSWFECKLTLERLSTEAAEKVSVSGIKFGMSYEEVEEIIGGMKLVPFSDLYSSIYSPDKSVRYDIEFDEKTDKVCAITVEYDESKSVRNYYK